MTNRPRYVFDTGVLVSAAIFKEATPGQAVLTALTMGELLFSPDTAQELQQVLMRPKFDRYLQLSTRRRFLAALFRQATIIETESLFQICRDPHDDKFLNLAVIGQAAYLVASDDDLLVLDPFQGIPIVTPTEFLVKVPK
ncbi:MAG: putative toxin-antitoxin system toxin component, PIN family [Thermoguttaceae bacterium]|jgi:putative PIN family toxin of toxin-antitoxin system